MFRLLRWLFLLAILAALSGFVFTHELAGQTSAERACQLWGSRPCARTARRWGRELSDFEASVETRLHGAAPPAAAVPSHGSPGTAWSHERSAFVRDGQNSREAPPLDKHTPAERQALDRILVSRGSH